MARQKKVEEPGLLDVYASMAMISLILTDKERTMHSMEMVTKNAFAFAKEMMKQRQEAMKDE
jgi:hypothetical protein